MIYNKTQVIKNKNYIIGKNIRILREKVNIDNTAAFTELVEKSGFLTGFFNYVPVISLILAVIITIVSGIDYFVKNKSIISTNK